MIQMRDWKWYGWAGHLCVGHDCRFHLHTEVGNYRISTVGEYFSPLNKTGKMETLGGGEKDFYETMVFKLSQSRTCDCGCGAREVDNWSELDSMRYANAKDAQAGHLKICHKFANRKS